MTGDGPKAIFADAVGWLEARDWGAGTEVRISEAWEAIEARGRGGHRDRDAAAT